MLQASASRSSTRERPEVRSTRRLSSSTAALLNFVANDPAPAFIVATESGILHQMHKRAPDKLLLAAPPEANCACNECPFMRLNTEEKVYLALRDLEPRLELPEELRARAQIPIDRMLALS